MTRTTTCLAATLAALLVLSPLGIAPEHTEQTATNPGAPVNVKTLFCYDTCNYLWQRTTEKRITLTVTNNLNADVYSCVWEGPGPPEPCTGAIPRCSIITSTLHAEEAPQATTVTWHPTGPC